MAPRPLPGGLLIAIEGIDGAGKTTLARAIVQSFRSVDAKVSLSKEPTHGQYGQQIRSAAASGRLSAEDEFSLLILDRREHVSDLIQPALGRGEVVILDRYFPSMAAYQGAAGISVPTILAANAFAPAPDVLLILDLDPAEGLNRIRSRGDTPNAFEDEPTLQKCREIFLSLHLPNSTVIDANLPAIEVHAIAMRQILLAISGKAMCVHGRTPEAAEAVREYMPAL